MTKCVFFTNLDEAQPYVRPLNARDGEGTRWLGPVPVVGNEVLFRVHERFTFRLRVCAITWNPRGDEAQVELHLPPAPHTSIKSWMDWFKRHERGE